MGVLVAALRCRKEELIATCGPRSLGLISLESLMSIFAFACPDIGLYSRWMLAWKESVMLRKLALALAADEHRLLALQNRMASLEEFSDELITEMGKMDNRVQEARKIRW